jgi:hypothetical protein
MLAMDDTIACPGCARHLRLPAAQRDQPVRCPGCGKTFRLARGPVIETGIQVEPAQRRGQFQADEPVRRKPFFQLDDEDIPSHLRPAVLPDKLPGAWLSTALVFLLGASVVMDLLYLAAVAALYRAEGSLTHLTSGPFWGPNEIGEFECMWLLLLVPTAVVFSVWMYRSYRNLLDMGVERLCHSPGWAAGSCFAPILGLFLPCVIAQEMWRASDPDQPIDTWEWPHGKGSALIGWWWVLWIIHCFLYADRGHGIVEGKVLSIVAAVLAILMVRRLRARQVRKLEVLRSS